MRGRLCLLLLSPFLGLAGALPASASQTLPSPLGLTCAQPTPSSAIVCSGKVPSFDGVPLDVDLTLPSSELTPRPLLVMLHGYGNDKTEWESATATSTNPDKDHYNTAWFASRGYAVLTYTARGFHGSCGQGPLTDPRCLNGWTHLADRRFEVRDTQYLAGLLADAGVADPQKVGVTGGSYGGGQSLLLAIQGDKVAQVPDLANPATYDQATLVDWMSPTKHTPMHLAAAVPKYPWSDLIESLVPNGRASDGVIIPDGNRIDPVGIEKQSYVSYLFFSGTVPTGYYCGVAAPCTDPSANLNAWFAEVSAGEPNRPDLSPVLAQALDELKTWKSAFYQDALIARTTDQVPIFDIQGWTDNLFPEVEGVSLINKLRAQGWPVKIAVADAGHPLAQDKTSVWAPLNEAATDFLDHYLMGRGSVALDGTAQVTQCGSGAGTIYQKASWASLAAYRITFSSTAPKATTSTVASDTQEARTDPIAVAAQNNAHGACVIIPAASSIPTAVWDFPVTNAFTLLGEPALHLDLTVSGTDAEVDALLWDVAADGVNKTLVTRGAYRFSGSPGSTSIDIPLQGNGWDFALGHTIRLEVTQNDAPYLRIDNLLSTIAYTRMTLTLPIPTAPTTSTTAGTSTGMGSTSAATVSMLAATGATGAASSAAPLAALLFLLSGLLAWRQWPAIQATRQRRQKR
jgi:predicted esterase